MQTLTKAFLTLMFCCFTLTAFAEQHIVVKSDAVKWTDGPKSLPAGAKVALLEGDPAKKGPFTLRLQFPANYVIMPHWHPAIEHITVLEGKFHVGLGEKLKKEEAQELSVGSFVVMPIKHRHFAFTSDTSSVVQLHGVGPWDIFYVNPADDPRKK